MIHSPETREKALALFAAGMSAEDVAEAVGASGDTVRRWTHDAEDAIEIEPEDIGVLPEAEELERLRVELAEWLGTLKACRAKIKQDFQQKRSPVQDITSAAVSTDKILVLLKRLDETSGLPREWPQDADGQKAIAAQLLYRQARAGSAKALDALITRFVPVEPIEVTVRHSKVAADDPNPDAGSAAASK